MENNLKITRITVTLYSYEVADLGLEERLGFDTVYRAGSRLPLNGAILTIETNAGIKGEVPGNIDQRSAQYLLGLRHLPRWGGRHRPAAERDHDPGEPH